MDTFTVQYCFQIDGNPFEDQVTWTIIQGLPKELINAKDEPTTIDTASGDKMIVATVSDGTHMVLHAYQSGMVTMDIQYDNSKIAKEKIKSLITKSAIKDTEKRIKELLGKKCFFTRGIPAAIKRGRVCPYFVRSDHTLFEHKPMSLVYEVNSKWQNIKIYKTEDSGNMLCLDDYIMIAEADKSYTFALLGVDRHSLKNKSVLILGGGDGGVIHELLSKHSPDHVMMVEIDFEVIKACRLHMRKLCGNTLDKLEGDHHCILIEDCRNFLKKCIEKGEKFDYVINNLPMYVINTDIGHDRDFTLSAKILECAMAVTKSGGRHLFRGDCASNKESIEALENDLKKKGLRFKKFVIDVPSSGEKYCTFEVWKQGH